MFLAGITVSGQVSYALPSRLFPLNCQIDDIFGAAGVNPSLLRASGCPQWVASGRWPPAGNPTFLPLAAKSERRVLALGECLLMTQSGFTRLTGATEILRRAGRDAAETYVTALPPPGIVGPTPLFGTHTFRGPSQL